MTATGPKRWVFASLPAATFSTPGLSARASYDDTGPLADVPAVREPFPVRVQPNVAQVIVRGDRAQAEVAGKGMYLAVYGDPQAAHACGPRPYLARIDGSSPADRYEWRVIGNGARYGHTHE